ncbi:hypothetical protein ES703_52072 [subsurface metagenome]
MPIAVAAASARAVDLESTITASALPWLRECPTVPEEVQMPMGVYLPLTSSPTVPVKGDLPA